MPRPCHCDRARKGQPFDPARDCRRCWLWHHHPPYRTHHGGGPAAGKKLPPRRAVDCVHLGKKQPGQASSCRGLCFHVCEAGLGVRGTARPGVECQGCPKYEADR